MQIRSVSVAIVLVTLASVSVAAIPSADTAIFPLTATFGTPGRRTLDVRERVALLCGGSAQSCQIFCAQTTFGGRHQDRYALCRVTYRCGATLVRIAEAARDEPLSLRCEPPRPMSVPAAAEGEPVPPPMSAN